MIIMLQNGRISPTKLLDIFKNDLGFYKLIFIYIFINDIFYSIFHELSRGTIFILVRLLVFLYDRSKIDVRHENRHR